MWVLPPLPRAAWPALLGAPERPDGKRTPLPATLCCGMRSSPCPAAPCTVLSCCPRPGCALPSVFPACRARRCCARQWGPPRTWRFVRTLSSCCGTWRPTTASAASSQVGGCRAALRAAGPGRATGLGGGLRGASVAACGGVQQLRGPALHVLTLPVCLLCLLPACCACPLSSVPACRGHPGAAEPAGGHQQRPDCLPHPSPHVPLLHAA